MKGCDEHSVRRCSLLWGCSSNTTTITPAITTTATETGVCSSCVVGVVRGAFSLFECASSPLSLSHSLSHSFVLFWFLHLCFALSLYHLLHRIVSQQKHFTHTDTPAKIHIPSLTHSLTHSHMQQTSFERLTQKLLERSVSVTASATNSIAATAASSSTAFGVVVVFLVLLLLLWKFV